MAGAAAAGRGHHGLLLRPLRAPPSLLLPAGEWRLVLGPAGASGAVGCSLGGAPAGTSRASQSVPGGACARGGGRSGGHRAGDRCGARLEGAREKRRARAGRGRCLAASGGEGAGPGVRRGRVRVVCALLTQGRRRALSEPRQPRVRCAVRVRDCEVQSGVHLGAGPPRPPQSGRDAGERRGRELAPGLALGPFCAAD